MILFVLRRYVLPASVLWFSATVIVVGLWTLMAIGTDSDPLNYGYANAYLQVEIRTGQMPKATVERQLVALRWRLFHWIVAEARFPVLLSALSIPILAWLMARVRDERWVVTWSTLTFAVLLPIFLLPVGTVLAGKLGDLHESRSAIAAPATTPTPTPTLDRGSR